MTGSPLIIAILTGVVVAGFVWFGWSLVENVMHTLNAPKPPSDSEENAGGK